jgi:hypothetical protein
MATKTRFHRPSGYERASFTLLYCSNQSGRGAMAAAANIWSAVYGKGNTLTVCQAADSEKSSIGAFLSAPWLSQDVFVQVR